MHAPEKTPVLAVCGKGGVGKTAVAALVGRALVDMGKTPLLLVDADPVGGLTGAVGARPPRTLAEVRAHLVSMARASDGVTRQVLAEELDYRVLQALWEADDHALIAMGRTLAKGCFCPANAILREALSALSGGFAAVLVDAEAGVEQIHREVTREVTRILVVLDGSARSRDTLAAIAELVDPSRIWVAQNRVRPGIASEGRAGRSCSEMAQNRVRPDHAGSVPLPLPAPVLGSIPEDDELCDFDREGRPLWDLPSGNPAVAAARRLAEALWGTLEARP